MTMADEDETRITIDEINETLRLGVDAADEERASELETFLLPRAARGAGLGGGLRGRPPGVAPASLRNPLVALFDRAGKRLEGTESPIDELGRFLVKFT